MKTGQCSCGNRVFFNNTQCVKCESALGFCTQCDSLSSFQAQDASVDRVAAVDRVKAEETLLAEKPVRCDSCRNRVFPCKNQDHAVCRSFNEQPDVFCQWCEFTDVIPDLRDPQRTHRWAVAETAKRRLLWQLKRLSLPPFVGDSGATHPLRFAFKEASVDSSGKSVDVTMGHQNGLITIDLAEADSVHRENLRVQFAEPQRTLIGHMRHEVGHYIDWSWANRVAKDEYCELFGDPDSLDYSQAMQRHYDVGPPADWAELHVSAYATMHPWEDFAESVNAYLDVMAIAETASELGRYELDLSPNADAKLLIASVLDIVVEVSEYNFDLGLPALLPERLSPTAMEKIRFVHCLRSAKPPSGIIVD